MEKKEIAAVFARIAGEDNCAQDVSLADYTTFRIGGPADFMVRPQNAGQLSEVVGFCRAENLPWLLLGKGSNLLVSDEGFRGVILLPEGELAGIQLESGRLTAGCAVSLAKIARAALEAELTGFEFAAGIPGSLGGAVYMNAGAYGGEMKQVLDSITYLDEKGFHTISAEDARLGYRTSRFMEQGGLVAGAVLTLKPGRREEIFALMQDLAAKRKAKQPLEFPSAGSMFKRPEGYFAGKLIQDAGLAGFRQNDAQVSEKHCGFVINTGGAKASDVRELVRQVHLRVKERFGVELWPEVRYLTPYGLAPLLDRKGVQCGI